MGSAMAFDILSFLAGIAAGAITGALAGVLHSLENTADLQEKLRHVTKEVERVKSTIAANTSAVSEHKESADVEELYRDLNEIHEEIRRMYQKGRS
jgi:gas vesicle protein